MTTYQSLYDFSGLFMSAQQCDLFISGVSGTTAAVLLSIFGKSPAKPALAFLIATTAIQLGFALFAFISSCGLRAEVRRSAETETPMSSRWHKLYGVSVLLQTLLLIALLVVGTLVVWGSQWGDVHVMDPELYEHCNWFLICCWVILPLHRCCCGTTLAVMAYKIPGDDDEGPAHPYFNVPPRDTSPLLNQNPDSAAGSSARDRMMMSPREAYTIPFLQRVAEIGWRVRAFGAGSQQGRRATYRA